MDNIKRNMILGIVFGLVLTTYVSAFCGRDVVQTCVFSRDVQGMSCNSNYMKAYCKKTCCNDGGGVRTDRPTQRPPQTQGPTNQGCGKSFFSQSKVISGTTAREGAWPWQILLKNNGRPGCGGSLISPEWVVTAAHCINGGSYSIVLGEHDRNRKTGNEQEIRSSMAFTHPGYNRRTFDNDIALIKLSRPAQLNSHVQPVCLPQSPAPVGSSCYITGWGKTYSSGQMHHVLQQAPMQVIAKSTCHAKNFKNIKVSITDQMICGGGSGRVSGCQGDSGGPFVCNLNGRWELHGAVSHGSRNCDSSKTYTVFARVQKFRSWIKQKTGV